MVLESRAVARQSGGKQGLLRQAVADPEQGRKLERQAGGPTMERVCRQMLIQRRRRALRVRNFEFVQPLPRDRSGLSKAEWNHQESFLAAFFGRSRFWKWKRMTSSSRARDVKRLVHSAPRRPMKRMSVRDEDAEIAILPKGFTRKYGTGCRCRTGRSAQGVELRRVSDSLTPNASSAFPGVPPHCA